MVSGQGEDLPDVTPIANKAIEAAEKLFSEYEVISKVSRKMGFLPEEKSYEVFEGLEKVRSHIVEQFIGTDFETDGGPAEVSAHYAGQGIVFRKGTEGAENSLPVDIVFGELEQRITSVYSDLGFKLKGEYDRRMFEEMYGIPRIEVEAFPILLKQMQEDAEVNYRFLMEVAADEQELTPINIGESSQLHQAWVIQDAADYFHEALGNLVEQKLGIPRATDNVKVIITQGPRVATDIGQGNLYIPVQSIAGVTQENGVQFQPAKFFLSYFKGMAEMAHTYHTHTTSLPDFIREGHVSSIGTLEALKRFYTFILLDELENDFTMRKDLDLMDDENNPIHVAKAYANHLNYINHLDAYIMSHFVAEEPMNLDHGEFAERINYLSTQVYDHCFNKQIANQRISRMTSMMRSDCMLQDMSDIHEMAYALDPVNTVICDLEDEDIDYNASLYNGIDKIMLAGNWSPFFFMRNTWIKTHDLYLKQTTPDGEETFFEGTSVIQ